MGKIIDGKHIKIDFDIFGEILLIRNENNIKCFIDEELQMVFYPYEINEKGETVFYGEKM